MNGVAGQGVSTAEALRAMLAGLALVTVAVVYALTRTVPVELGGLAVALVGGYLGATVPTHAAPAPVSNPPD